MKYTDKIKITLLALFSIVFFSCLDEEATDFGKGPIVVQFPNSKMTGNFLLDGKGTTYDFKVSVQYYGKNGKTLDEDVTVTLGVDKDKSTAKEGVEFSLPVTNITIPAGKSVADVTVKVNSTNLDASAPKVVALEILDSSKNPSGNRGTVLLTLQGVCPSKLAGKWEYITGKKREVTIKETGIGTYTVSADDAFKGLYPIYFSDVCGNITITGGYLTDNFNIAVSGNGSVSNDKKKITLVYTANGYLSGRTMVLERK